MATKMVSVRLDEALVEWLDGYAAQRGSKRSAVVAAAVESLRDLAQGGVPDLESASGMTPRPSPAGREAKSEVAQQRTGARATAPQRAPVSAPTRDPRTIPGVTTGTELWRQRPLIDVVAALSGVGKARARVRLAEGRVSVDGLTVKDPELKVDPRTVTVAEQAIRSAREERRERKTI